MDNFVIKKNKKPMQHATPINVYTDGACSNNGKPDARAGFGVYFGENFTGVNVRIDEAYQDQWKQDFSSKFNLSIGLRMSMGPLAVGGGFTSRSYAVSDEIETSISNGYLEFWSVYPLILGPISIWTGPNIAFPLGGKTTEDGISWKTSRDCENIPLNTPYQCTDPNFDFGLLFGLSIPIGRSMAFSNGYYLGFMEIFESESYFDAEHTNSDNTKIRWNSIFATITYKL